MPITKSELSILMHTIGSEVRTFVRREIHNALADQALTQSREVNAARQKVFETVLKVKHDEAIEALTARLEALEKAVGLK